MTDICQIPVVILAGGRGSRLGEYTDVVPKPMVKIQGIPIIDRIICNFKNSGFQRFIVSSGYKHQVLHEHFRGDMSVCVFNTGEDTQTAGRILGVKDLIETDVFMACYGDGITDYNPATLLEQHSRNDSICTLLTVHPRGRFGELSFNPRGLVTSFSEKPMEDKWINAGYFCFSKKIFEYLEKDFVLETDVFGRLVAEKKLFCDSHEGFWRNVDTPKDVAELNSMRLP